LVISDFTLPLSLGTTTLTMKPFRVELLAKNKIIKELTEEFPATEKRNGNYCKYSTSLNLSSIWTKAVDLIRITWSIHVQECGLNVIKEI
jgi:hypothetical protein